MKEIIMLKLGEAMLKGLNRGRFESRLLSNTRFALKMFGSADIYASQSTVYVSPTQDFDIGAAFAAAKRVFGFVAATRAAVCEKDMPEIIQCAAKYLERDLSSARTFKVEARRADKSFHLKSPQICEQVGGALIEMFPHLKVDVRNPGLLVMVEIREHSAYIHTASDPGAGGMPTGSNGRVALLLSGGIDSPVAGWLAARRGVWLEGIHFWSYPYTSVEAKEKTIAIAELMAKWCGRFHLSIVPFTKIQEEIHKSCPQSLYTVIMRRFMMRISEAIAKNYLCGALVTGECLGQVASQTLEALGVTGEVCSLPVLRPVIALDKQDIVNYAKHIGTFETSLLPHEDCCTVFTPRHPKTKPNIGEVISAESGLDIERLVSSALELVERLEIRP